MTYTGASPAASNTRGVNVDAYIALMCADGAIVGYARLGACVPPVTLLTGTITIIIGSSRPRCPRR